MASCRSKIADLDEVMYRAGAETLHPGGLAKTDDMARLCGVGPGKRVLDVGSGKGTTACHLARAFGCSVVGLDRSAWMVAAGVRRAEREGLQALVRFQAGDACALPFEDASFDIVLSECTTTMLDRTAAFAQFVRVLRPGGWVGDLEITWRHRPPEAVLANVRDAWSGFTTMTVPEWKAFFEGLGLADVKAVEFGEGLKESQKQWKRELGLKGQAKMALVLLVRPRLRRAMIESLAAFRRCGDCLGCAYVVGRKP